MTGCSHEAIFSARESQNRGIPSIENNNYQFCLLLPKTELQTKFLIGQRRGAPRSGSSQIRKCLFWFLKNAKKLIDLPLRLTRRYHIGKPKTMLAAMVPERVGDSFLSRISNTGAAFTSAEDLIQMINNLVINPTQAVRAVHARIDSGRISGCASFSRTHKFLRRPALVRLINLTLARLTCHVCLLHWIRSRNRR